MLKKIIVTMLALGACIAAVSIISAFSHTGANNMPETTVEMEVSYAQTTLKGRVNADGTIADPGTGGWVVNKTGEAVYKITVTDVGFTPTGIIGVASAFSLDSYASVNYDLSSNTIFVAIRNYNGYPNPGYGFSFFLYVKG